MLVVALLLLLLQGTRAALDLSLVNLTDDQCTSSAAAADKSVTYLTKTEVVQNWYVNGSFYYSPIREVATYSIQGVERVNGQCQYCRYHEVRNKQGNTPPMYGPCLGNLPSLKIPCWQNPSLWLPSFFGTFYYPDQRPISDWSSLLWSEPVPVHMFLMQGQAGSSNVRYNAQIPPSEYGLGYDNVMSRMGNNSMSSWLEFAQIFCFPGCHRNSSIQLVNVTSSSWSSTVTEAVQISQLRRNFENKQQLRCVACPRSTTQDIAYAWNEAADAPLSIQAHSLSYDCWPWLGVLPLLRIDASLSPDNRYYQVDFVYSDSVNLPPHVLYPTSVKTVNTTACPVDTYSRTCAHTLRYYRRVSHLQNNAAALSCTPCPQDYSTQGRTGQWYCHPPQGYYFVNHEAIAAGAIFRRNTEIELECGPTAAHCKQCGTNTTQLPDEFNEQFTFQPMLQVRPCPLNTYCPSAMQAPMQCPDHLPSSPMGSASIENCSCALGSYRANATACLPCTRTCPAGQYAEVWSCFNAMSSPRSDTPCKPCTNVPANATLTAGFQSSGSTAACNFRCNIGFKLMMASEYNQCGSSYTCEPIQPIRNNRGQLVHSVRLPFDEWKDCSPVYNVVPFIENNVQNENVFTTTTTSCAGCSVASAVACRPETGYLPYRDINCVACSQPAAGLEYTTGAFNSLLSMPQAWCQLRCSNTSKFLENQTCFACADRESQTCQQGQRLTGLGCLGSGLLDPLNCTACSKQPSECGAMWLDTAAGAACACKPCQALPQSGYYWQTLCGGTNQGVQRQHSVCLSNQYKTGVNTNVSTITCSNCTSRKPGYYLNETSLYCTQVLDAVWKPCPAGYYCTGEKDRQPTPCNAGYTSLGGSVYTSADTCICQLGMQKVLTGQCVSYTCPETVPRNDTPGNLWRSPYYMTLTAQGSTCHPCGSDGAFATGKLPLTTCTCPQGYYGELNTTGHLNCSASCPSSSSSCPNNSTASEVCWSGTLRQAPQCKCVAPPHSALFFAPSSSPCAFTCNAGYAQQQQGSASLAQNATGSALYTTSRAWSGVLLQQGPFVDVAVAQNGPANAQQGPPFLLVITEAQRADLTIYDMSTMLLKCTLTLGDPVNFPLVALASGTRLNGMMPAAVAYTKNDGSIWMKWAKLNPAQACAASPDWTAGVSISSNNGALVAMQHLATTAAVEAFYVAYNNQNFASTVTRVLVNGTKQELNIQYTLTAMVATAAAAADTVNIYFAHSAGISKAQWSSGSQAIAAYYEGPLTFKRLLLLVATTPPLLLGCTQDGDILSLPEAVQIQGLPPQSKTTGLLAITQQLTMVAASDQSLFSIQLSQCTDNQFWDGEACRNPICTNVCPANRQLVNQACVCNNGLYENTQSRTCVDCLSGSYCVGGQLLACPNQTSSAARSTGPEACSCNLGKYYDGGKCADCPSGRWCPNKWSAVQCPGNALYTAASPFPTPCRCAAGYTGVQCTSCPKPLYCPLSSTKRVTNMALLLTVERTAAAVNLDAIAQELLKRFSSSNNYPAYLRDAAALQSRLYVRLVERLGEATIAVMLQVNAEDELTVTITFMSELTFRLQQQQSKAVWPNGNFTLLRYSPIGDKPDSGTGAFFANEPTQCPAGKTATDAMDACWCAPGYEGPTCKPCARGTYKEKPGDTTACVNCPIGTGNEVEGSTACTAQATAQAAASSDLNTIAIGAIIGGVALAGMLLYGVTYYVKKEGKKQ